MGWGGTTRRSQQGTERAPSGRALWENTEVACHGSNPEVHRTRALLDSRGRFVRFHVFFHSWFCFLLYFLEKLQVLNSNFSFLVKIWLRMAYIFLKLAYFFVLNARESLCLKFFKRLHSCCWRCIKGREFSFVLFLRHRCIH